MKLLINAIPLLGQQTGVGNYARYVAEAALGPETTFFYGYYSKTLPGHNPKTRFIQQIRQIARKRSIFRRICKKGLTLGNLAFNYLFDSVYDCYFEPNFLLLPPIRARHSVITIHDFSCFQYPQWHPAERVRQMENQLWKSAERADRIITVSESIRKEAIEKYGLPAGKVTVIPNGVNHDLFQPASQPARDVLLRKYDLPREFVLFVGAVEPRKNLKGLIEAYSALPESLKRKFPLIFAGSCGWNNEEIIGLMQKGRIRFLGYLPENDLSTLYSCATLLVYPSWYEGFGLPVLEAMACGCPVLASTDAALRELSDNSACHVQPGDIAAMSNALRELLEDENRRRELSLAGLARAQAFDWDKSAMRHLRLFGEVAGC